MNLVSDSKPNSLRSQAGRPDRLFPASARAFPALVAALCAPAMAAAGTLVEGGGHWFVEDAKASTAVPDLDRADLTVRGFNRTSLALRAAPTINYGTGAQGNFAGDEGFPNALAGGDDFAVRASGEIDLKAAGTVTFGLRADDNATLRVGGGVVVTTTNGANTHLGSVDLAAGRHAVEVLHYDDAGAEHLEVFVATEPGAFADFGATTWELLEVVGDLAPTAVLADSGQVPANALAGSVVANLSAVDPAGRSQTFSLVYPGELTTDVAVAPGSEWSYLDDGSDQGSAWREPDFDDAAWASGPAPLGYGDAEVVTTVSFGPDDMAKFTTTYFRRSFEVAGLDDIAEVRVLLQRDDGAAVYINGVEAVRDSLPAAPAVIAFDTTAAPTAGGTAETTFFRFEIDPALLLDGSNEIAVEVHQANATSSDLRFDLGLEIDRTSDFGDAVHFAIDGRRLLLADAVADIPGAGVGRTFDLTLRATSETGLSVQDDFTVAVVANATAAPSAVALDNAAVGEGLPAGEIVGRLSAVDGDTGDGFAFALVDAAAFPDNAAFAIDGDWLRTAAVLDAVAQGSYEVQVAATDTTGNSLAMPFTVTVEPAPPAIGIDSPTVPINAVAGAVVGSLTTEDPFGRGHAYRFVQTLNPDPIVLIDAGSAWRYLDDGTDQGTAWREVDFDDGGWAEGDAPLGYGDPATTVIDFGGDANNKHITYYFRRELVLPLVDVIAGARVFIRRDDAAVIYVNGTEVVRDANLPAAPAVIGFQTLATAGVADENAFTEFTIDEGLLRVGPNSFAVEVHQTSLTSSDVSFDLSFEVDEVIDKGGGNFFRIENDLLVLVDTPANLGLAENDTVTFDLTSTSDLGVVRTGSLTVTVGPALDSAPTDITLSAAAVAEGLPAGTRVGRLSAVDPDVGDAFAFALVEPGAFPDNASFAIDGGDLVTAAVLDFDDQRTFSIRVEATDSAGLSTRKTLEITVNPVPVPPSAIALSVAQIPLSSPPGTVVGTLSVTDENASDAHLLTIATDPRSPVEIVGFGSVWSFLDDGSDQGVAWRGPAFDDGAWASGAAELGYGDGDEVTTVDFGGDAQAKFITTYFRHRFSVADTAGFSGVRLRLLADDGAAVYLNGGELGRQNLPAAAAFDTVASATATEGQILAFTIDGDLLQVGENVLAVEVHQASGTSSDISFDLGLDALAPNPLADLFRVDGDQLVVDGDLAGSGLATGQTVDVTVRATDGGGLSLDQTFAVLMISDDPGDIDGDGLPDAFETTHFGGLGEGPGGDFDLDGVSNLAEFLTGTGPADPDDALRLPRPDLGAGGDIVINWASTAGTTYQVQVKDDLSEPAWAPLGAPVQAVGASSSVTDPAATARPHRFYRVVPVAP